MMSRSIEALRREFALQCELTYLRAHQLVATKHGGEDDVGTTRRRITHLQGVLRDIPADGDGIRAIAQRLGLDATQTAFLWSAVAVAGDPRVSFVLAVIDRQAERGLSVASFAELLGLEPHVAHELVTWLVRADNPLVALGLLIQGEAAITPVARPFAAPPRLLRHLRGDDAPDAPIAQLAPASRTLFFDADQEVAIDALRQALERPSSDLLVLLEGATGSGRRTAAAHASGSPMVVLDASSVDPHGVESALVGLRREAFLTRTIPVVANVEVAESPERAAVAATTIGRAIEAWVGPLVVTTSFSGFDLATRRTMVRVRWPIPGAALRRRLWVSLATGPRGATPSGDLDTLAHRYRVGADGIARAAATARRLVGRDEEITAGQLTHGLRHNIAQRLGTLAKRVEVTQSWDDLVVADDTAAQLDALIARVRYSMQVLEAWGYKDKMPRGTGVAALLSGPPGTGKSMCAGLIARELQLELYQVDLSQVVSKWVGETEKQLARIFDAAEEGHALLLFDEADALFGQRSIEMKGAVDRYANLEVNFLLQRIESFGGITILTTNLDTTIDRAVKRRLAAHIVFAAPDEDERTALWERLTRTATAPLAADVDCEALARSYPNMTGANIRNAALSAAFLAAANGAREIGQEHLDRAARIEYRAMGHVLSDAPIRRGSTLR